MAKELKAQVKLQIPGGAATPAPPVGSSLGQHGVNIMEFCKQFNAATASRKGETVPVVISIYKDKTFTFIIKTPPVSELIKKRISLSKGSAKPNTDKVGKISWRDIEEIAKIKLPDLNANDIDQARKIIAGSARSMGVDVID
ncbi:MAG: 50S ribosomal protein L11 [Candidatus Babeliales bacterium]|nr:50S ribosomal protein L11 [Candidatus Babeliales bacterium]